MSAGAAEAAAFTWSPGLFGLIAEPGSGRATERLAVCTAHKGQHVFYGPRGEEWCQALPPHHRPRPLRREQPTHAPIVVQFDPHQLAEAVAAGVELGARWVSEERSR